MHGEIKTPENGPIEITSTGQTTYENGLATARDNVAIHIGNTDIYADYAQYNPPRHDVELRGHVRIYRDASLYNADSGIYNTETKRSGRSRTDGVTTYFLGGNDVTSIEGEENAYLINGGIFTTHDSSKPDFHLRAHKIRVYEDDRVIFLNVTAYVGKVPIFWWPYLYQSLDNAFSFFHLARILQHLGDHHCSHRSRSRSQTVSKPVSGWIISAGADQPSVFEPTIEYGKDKSSVARIKTFLHQRPKPGDQSNRRTRGWACLNRDTGSTLEDHTDFNRLHLRHRQHHQAE
jgi:hypothetical protein